MRNVMAVAGLICVFGAAGTDQMYTECGNIPPNDLWIVFAVGFALLLPKIFEKRKETK